MFPGAELYPDPDSSDDDDDLEDEEVGEPSSELEPVNNETSETVEDQHNPTPVVTDDNNVI